MYKQDLNTFLMFNIITLLSMFSYTFIGIPLFCIVFGIYSGLNILSLISLNQAILANLPKKELHVYATNVANAAMAYGKRTYKKNILIKFITSGPWISIIIGKKEILINNMLFQSPIYLLIIFVLHKISYNDRFYLIYQGFAAVEFITVTLCSVLLYVRYMRTYKLILKDNLAEKIFKEYS